MHQWLWVPSQYHEPVQEEESLSWGEHHGDFSFWIKLYDFEGVLQEEEFINWLNNVEMIFFSIRKFWNIYELN
jgi:hypothetical protein